MIMIIGGQGQGKLEFAHKLIDAGQAGPGFVHAANAGRESVADGRFDSYDSAFSSEIVYHLEIYVRRLLLEGGDPAAFAARLIGEGREIIVIADEIGCGIVPADAFERSYREIDGRLCQQAASAAGAVYRVVCGIGVRIK